jgi:hypothetical protein
MQRASTRHGRPPCANEQESPAEDVGDNPPVTSSSSTAAVVGGGPAGLMAAEMLVQQGVAVDLFDAMPSVGRKFLLAGRGGLNLTHSEPPEPFMARYSPLDDAWRQAWPTSGATPCGSGPPAWASRPSSAPRAACSPRT